MVFHIPPDSLALRYNDSHREVTWEGVRGPSDVKILGEIRDQIGATCIYEAIAAWMDSLVRLAGRICKISSKDLQNKEQNLMSERTDRTMRCIEVLKFIGVCSEEDFVSQNPNATIYKLVDVTLFMPLNEQDLTKAVERMHETPLLLVFHIGSNYNDYVITFQQRPVLSYERFEEAKMQGHAVCAMGYGVEAVVPFWKFMNSHKKIGPTKGLGRVLPQNVYYLIAPNALKIFDPEAALNLRKRKFDDDGRPTKKQKMAYHELRMA